MGGEGVPRPLLTMTPKGPINNIIIVFLAIFLIVKVKIIIIGPFGVMVIRGRGTPLYVRCRYAELQETSAMRQREEVTPGRPIGANNNLACEKSLRNTPGIPQESFIV